MHEPLIKDIEQALIAVAAGYGVVAFLYIYYQLAEIARGIANASKGEPSDGRPDV